MSKKFPKLSLIIGGANSGKSAFAERLIRVSSLPKTYIATAQAFDDEMRTKINVVLRLEKDKILSMGNKARKHVIKKFSKDSMLQSYLDFYQEL